MVAGAIPSPPEHFVGRRRSSAGSRKRPAPAGSSIVEGAAGMGKTSLVTKYVRRLRSNRLRFWFTVRAGSLPSHLTLALAHSLANLGGQQLAQYLSAPASTDRAGGRGPDPAGDGGSRNRDRPRRHAPRPAGAAKVPDGSRDRLRRRPDGPLHPDRAARAVPGHRGGPDPPAPGEGAGPSGRPRAHRPPGRSRATVRTDLRGQPGEPSPAPARRVVARDGPDAPGPPGGPGRPPLRGGTTGARSPGARRGVVAPSVPAQGPDAQGHPPLGARPAGDRPTVPGRTDRHGPGRPRGAHRTHPSLR